MYNKDNNFNDEKMSSKVISNEILYDLICDIKKDISDFKQDIKKDMHDLKEDMNRRFDLNHEEHQEMK